MRKLLIAVALMLPMTSYAWAPREANEAINQTNFIVHDKCSGTLISLDHKLILTNHHCVEHKIKTKTEKKSIDGVVKERVVEVRGEIPVKQMAYQGYEAVGSSTYQTEIVAHDERKDLALLKIKADDIPHSTHSPIPSKERTLVRGETAYAVGNPRMLDATITKGIVSSTTRMLKASWAPDDKTPFIQYDGGAAPGSSGGALYDNNGYLIGVPARGISDTLVFAIHTDIIREFLDDSCYPVYEGGVLVEGTELEDLEEKGFYCSDWGEKEVEEKEDD